MGSSIIQKLIDDKKIVLMKYFGTGKSSCVKHADHQLRDYQSLNITCLHNCEIIKEIK